MSKGPQRIRGTQDIWGEDADRFNAVVAAFDRVRRLYAFQRIETPVFEATEIFSRSIGETTDIVAKEMYTFPDRGGDLLTLRPEFTAGICRAWLSEGWQQHAPMKLATHGPVFRYERPQKGRFRQFHQLDAEIIGTDAPAADVELLVLADQLLHELGIADGVTLELNTLGDATTRDAWRAALVAHFEAHRAELSDDSLARLGKNPLRILDSKAPQDRPIADAAPGIDDFLTPDAANFFAQVTAGLDAAGVAWTRNPRLVRGLDYYRHTAFEFVTDRLGAQGAVIAGGRYDGLIESLGGPHTPAVGWAAGIERLGMLIEARAAQDEPVVVIANGPAAVPLATKVSALLRGKGVAAEMPFRGSSNKLFVKAKDRGAKLVLIVARDDQAGWVRLRRLDPFNTELEERVTRALGAIRIADAMGDEHPIEPTMQVRLPS
jgi:histidyl-tRNA synthetase